ncbi:MAG: HAD hydrolase family protein, partial [Candidatus Hydrogenedentes bacterium]|nr:HAD hydrolase family protein [Candidatus Hydrogenedentota bacterium]
MSDLGTAMRRVRFIVSDVDGVLTDGTMGFDAEGRPFRHFNVRDGLGLALWYLAGGRAALVSGQGSPAVEALAKQWRCTDCLVHVRDKAAACRDLAGQYGVALEEMAFIGDDLIDIGAIRAVGLGVAVADAAGPVKDAAAHSTAAAGGAG